MTKNDFFPLIPKVDELLNSSEIKPYFKTIPRALIVEAIRDEIDKIRKKLMKMEDEDLPSNFNIDQAKLINDTIKNMCKKNEFNLRKVINATGVVLHTNLGRAILSESIIGQIASIAGNYSTLEFDIKTGERGSRYDHVEQILTKLTGAESALVVNNNAAAVLLVLGTMAKNKEIILSRGQLVEIGGSFRIPEVMEQSGATLVEIGTTNKTHLSDYEKAINEETAALLKVHTSNYKIMGFTKEVELASLVELGARYNIPIIEDLGSGTLIDLSKYGIQKEPTVQESIAAGVDVVTFSGDKLLGGPQAGIIIGKKKYIDPMKSNPLTRAFRVDKLTLSALEATLKLYYDEEIAISKIPTLNMLTISSADLEKKAEELKKRLDNNVENYLVEIIHGFSQVGGGSLPLVELPTMFVTVKPHKISINKCEELLRNYKIPIIARISDNKLILDVRTIDVKDFEIISEAITYIMNL